MKKLLTLFILALSLAMLFSFSALAVSNPATATITGANAKAGDEVTLSLTVKNSPGIVAAMFSIAYDSDVMEFVSCEGGTANDAGSNPVNVALINMALQDIYGDFKVADITFKIKDGAESGSYDLALSVTEAYNFNEEPIEFETESSTVTVRALGDVLAGDADDDGQVTILDAAKILQYKAGWSVDINLDASDVDGDGSVTILDAARILQYKAGWNVTLD